MPDEHLRELALTSESMLVGYPIAPIRNPQITAKALLVKDLTELAETSAKQAFLKLSPISDETDWARYTRHRVEVERGFGVDAPSALEMVRTVRSRVETVGLRMYIAARGSDVVGAICHFPIGFDFHPAHRLQEVDIFPGYRGEGLGNALLHRTTQRLKELGCSVAIAGADEDDWPIDWYQRHGFRLVTRVPLSR